MRIGIGPATLLVAAAVSVGLPSVGIAGPPSSTQHQATAATLRDGADDVLLSDGNPLYTGREVSSTRITDFSDPAAVDHFQFQGLHKRVVQINSDVVNAGTPTPCTFNYVVFRSSTVPNWYDVITGGSQSSVPSDAFFICHGDQVGGGKGTQWRVSYPDHPAECALIERLDATTWRFSVPPYTVDPVTGMGTGCPATLTASTQERGKETVNTYSGISATMDLTVTIP